jgi:hypothetical protein
LTIIFICGGTLIIVLNFNRGQNTRKDLNALLNRNFVKLERPQEYVRRPDKAPTPEALLMCRALKDDKLKEYLESLEKKPERKLIRIFSGIIDSSSAMLPILYDKELPPVIIAAVSFDPIQNVQARMMTKITLLLLIESESKKLGIWNQLQQKWTEKYIIETKMYVRILDAIIKQCENTGQKDKVVDLRKTVKLIKEANVQYTIDW